MKGKYGVSMNTYGHVLPGAIKLARIPVMSSEAKRRLKWIDHYQQSHNARLTCRHFDLPPKSFYKWLKRYQLLGLKGLENQSRRPKTFRQSAIPLEQIDTVIKRRTENPEFSKYKIDEVLKRDDGIVLSPSTIGRVFVKHRLFFPTPVAPKGHRHRSAIAKAQLHPYYRSQRPGELVEADMKHLSFFGTRRYLFAGIDCVTKRLAVHLGTSSSSRQASRLLDKMVATFPYPIEQLRVDHGSENLKDFAIKAAALGIKQYFTRVRRPQDKPFVERVIGTIEREFIQRGNLAIDLEDQRALVDQWVDRYNNFRPHQALGYLTPEAFERKLNQTS
jgi:transposase InsO family protein